MRMKGKHTRKPASRKSTDAEIEQLRKLPDSGIDYSDIAETDAAFWAKAEVSEPADKTMISIRIDSDLLDWYRSHARRYQTLINAVLRGYKEARELKENSRKGLG